MTVLGDDTDWVLRSPTVLSLENDNHNYMPIDESPNFSSLSENVSASLFQRPSCFDDLHCLNISNVTETSMPLSQVSQHSQDNKSNNTLPIIISDGYLSSSGGDSQEASGSQVSELDTQSSVTTSDSNPSFNVHDSQQVPLSQITGQEQAAPDNILNLGFKDKGFRIGHLNVQGVGNKIDQLRLLLQSEQNLIHILGISETKLSHVHPDTAFDINGYQKPFRRDRPENAGGGILM